MKMSGLALEKGAGSATLKEVIAAPRPLRKTATYQPVSM